MINSNFSKSILGDSELSISNIESDNDSDGFSEEESRYTCSIQKIFSCRFDSSDGPIIEWEYSNPDKKISIDGIEFTVLASGLHNETGPDFIYFKRGSYYGVACYRRHLKSKDGRDAIMRSIGIVMDHYGFLSKHIKFLESFSLQISNELFEDKYKQSFIEYFNNNQDNFDSFHIPNPLLSVNLPSGAMVDLFSQLSISIFTLWKLIMLGKKILFVSEPPVKTMCLNVYASSYLVSHKVNRFKLKVGEPYLLFYVNITQTRALLEPLNYLACTTEKIFESKKHLYDAIVINTGPKEERIKIFDKELYECTKITKGDNLRFTSLMQKYQAQNQSVLITFFQDMNNVLLNALNSFDGSNDIVRTSDLRKFGLHDSDFPFLTSLIDFLQLDIDYTQHSFNFCCF